MKNYYTCLLLVTFALMSGYTATGQDNNTSHPARPASLPDDPCEVLNPAQVSAVTGLEVTSVRRGPSIEEVIRAQDEKREAGPGMICCYETASDYGAITIAIPARAERSAALYWEKRAKYFEAFPGSAKSVADLGIDAWSAGGSTLNVLVSKDEYISLSTQMYKPGSRELLVKVARKVLDQLQ